MFATDSTGSPVLVSQARWDTVGSGLSDLVFLDWSESAWIPRFPGLAANLGTPEQVVSLDGRRGQAWLEYVIPSTLLIAEWTAQGLSAPDTVKGVTNSSAEFAAAAAGSRRWVVRCQKRPSPSTTYRVRVLYSDTAGTWHEVTDPPGIDEIHVAAAPLSETSLMVVYYGASGLSWAVLEGDEWVETGNLVSQPWSVRHPRLRLRPSGDLWLLATDNYAGRVWSFREGHWQAADTVWAEHPPGEEFGPAWCSVSHDTAERPLLVWGDLGYNVYRDVASLSFPTDEDWLSADEVPGSNGAWNPDVARDRYGDAWVAWSLIGTNGLYFNHTYVSAISHPPRFDSSRKTPSLRWQLAEPAPGSWWAVQRAEGTGEFQTLGRTQADDIHMSWHDGGAPQGTLLRYRIRRESMDRRYEWHSEEAVWWPRGATLGLGLRGPLPTFTTGVEVAVTGAEGGALEIHVYDLQGRLVLKQSEATSGSGSDTFRLDFGSAQSHMGSGVYFARAADATGRVSQAVKLVVLR